jgi:hypothetical protein
VRPSATLRPSLDQLQLAPAEAAYSPCRVQRDRKVCADMATGDLAEVSLLLNFGTAPDTFVNTFGFRALTGTATRAALATAFKTAVVKSASGGLLRSASATYGSTRLTVRDVLPGTGDLVESSYALVTGNNGNTVLPFTCAAVVTWKTGVAGRSFRGRTYLAGYCNDNQSAGVWNNALLTEIAAFVTQMLAVFGPGGSNGDWEFVVISREAGGSLRVPPIGTPITVGLPKSIVRQQRRRELGVGG